MYTCVRGVVTELEGDQWETDSWADREAQADGKVKLPCLPVLTSPAPME